MGTNTKKLSLATQICSAPVHKSAYPYSEDQNFLHIAATNTLSLSLASVKP